MIVTIDGPAGSGKSAVAQQVALRMALRHLDTGAMYRAVAFDALERKLTANPAEIAQRARDIRLEFDWDHRPARLYLDGRDVSDLIRHPDVTASTFLAADNVAVREEMVLRQRRIGAECVSLVTEGRDQGTVVFPDALFKFYLDAHPAERAKRRVKQLATKGIAADPDTTLLQIRQRDAGDQQREQGPLIVPADARIIDTTALSLEQVVDVLFGIVTGRRPT